MQQQKIAAVRLLTRGNQFHGVFRDVAVPVGAKWISAVVQGSNVILWASAPDPSLTTPATITITQPREGEEVPPGELIGVLPTDNALYASGLVVWVDVEVVTAKKRAA